MKINHIQKLLLAVAVTAALTGCATGTRSDSLGFAQNEAVKTYADAYQPARDLLNAGKFDELQAKVLLNGVDKDGQKLSKEETYEKLIADASELSMMERGLIALNTGDFEGALFFFDAAEEKLNLTEDNANVADQAGSMAKFGLAKLTGASEMADYEVRSYEKVMLLNYKALCYMLLGDRKAYNVTRRAIDLQQAEWEAFKQQKAELVAKLEKSGVSLDEKPAAEAKPKAKSVEELKREADERVADAQKSALSNAALGFLPGGLGSMAQTAKNTVDTVASIAEIFSEIKIDDRSKAVKNKANLVASAYVNPFGDYMNALMQEFDSLQDSSLRDNARISYEKVVENNKDCKAAQVAKTAVMKGIGGNQKIVQVILADGFAPYQVERSRQFVVGKYRATINLANATPVASPLASASVKVGGKASRMSSLTKMESIILRDEQDHFLWRTFDVATALLRSAAVNDKLGALGGDALAQVQHPDTRSWLTLPNQVLVSRLVVPASQQSLQISTFDKSGKTLATSSVKLAEEGPTVVYAVNYGTHMKAYANAFSWVK